MSAPSSHKSAFGYFRRRWWIGVLMGFFLGGGSYFFDMHGRSPYFVVDVGVGVFAGLGIVLFQSVMQASD